MVDSSHSSGKGKAYNGVSGKCSHQTLCLNKNVSFPNMHTLQTQTVTKIVALKCVKKEANKIVCLMHVIKMYLHRIAMALFLTRNCSKLRKIHSGQGPISLTINPSKFKFFGQFVLLWFEFSRCHLMSLQFLHMTLQVWHETHICCQGMRKICSDDQKMKYDKMKF